jgi:hypothetical protein
MIFPYLFALAWLVYPDCAKLTVVNPVFVPLSELLADAGVLQAAALNCSGVDLNRMLFFPPARQVDNLALSAITLPAITEMMLNSYHNSLFATPAWALSFILGGAQAGASIERLAFCKRSCLNADKTYFEPSEHEHLRTNVTVPVIDHPIDEIIDHLRHSEFATACTALSAMQPTSNMASDWSVQFQFCTQQVTPSDAHPMLGVTHRSVYASPCPVSKRFPRPNSVRRLKAAVSSTLTCSLWAGRSLSLYFSRRHLLLSSLWQSRQSRPRTVSGSACRS